MNNEIEVAPIDVMDISVRTEALMDDERFTMSEKVALAASEYKHALSHDYFAAAHGGVDKFKNQLFTLVDKWLEDFNPGEIE
ncbi:hypothetical protein [Pseudoalteromonas sp. 68 DY56-GL68]|uniref:hypothetical protein n=1 Tax=Pseudoalteromonas sp. 68 DY56-GL68 TaxID=2974919 RepID=UPI003529DFE5